MNSPPAPERFPIGLWLALVANAVGACAGAVFLFAEPGDRFRGMEPEAVGCVALCFVACGFGLFVALPASVWALVRSKRPWSGLAGVLLSFTPFLLAVVVSDLIAWQMGLVFD